MEKGQTFNLYRDIAERTDGDVYIGVIGPMRTGKSTFITRFMEELVLPRLPAGPKRDRVIDELPQSASGRTVMTSQPKFVPGEAAEIMLQEQTSVRVRMVDSVGYPVPGVLGTSENENMRMVTTPWSDQPMPFEQAAEVGTRRVMTDHATIGMVVTTDGSITDLPRSAYVDAEERVIGELKSLGKPYVIILNSATPRAAETLALRDALEDKYGVPVMLMNVKEMNVEHIQHVLESVLLEFPLREVRIAVPAWLSALDNDHWLVRHVLDGIRSGGSASHKMRETDLFADAFATSEYSGNMRQDSVTPGSGAMTFTLPMQDGLFNRVLGEQCGTEIRGDAHLLSLMKELVTAKAEYDQIAEALRSVRATGYGMVSPAMSEITLEEPEIIRRGSQYGIKLKAHAPSLHLIQTDIETEVTPIVGTEQQSEEMAQALIDTFESDPQKLWETSFFGKELSEMVREGIAGKLAKMPADAQEKIQETLSRMVNEGDGCMVCLLL